MDIAPDLVFMFEVLAPGKIVGALGRIDRGRLPHCHPTVAGYLPFAFWHSGKTWAAPATGHRSAECALCIAASRPAGVCRSVSRVFFWTDIRGTARTRHGCLQFAIAVG